MHIELTVRWTFQTNNYRCICFITKLLRNYYRTHSFPVYALTIGYSLIVCPYTQDSMNSYKIIFNVIEIGLPK